MATGVTDWWRDHFGRSEDQPLIFALPPRPYRDNSLSLALSHYPFSLTPGRFPLVNCTPAFSMAFLIAAMVSGLPMDLPRSIA
jgi:hypothetical protein